MDWIFEQPVKAGYTLNLESRNKCAAIMDRIVKEQPEYWPYGCDVSGFDDLYLVRKEADTQPVGFVGWQTREEKGARVGYYAIGILPEHRKQGFAKQAVAALLDKCASTVDKVRAFIMPNNGPSHALADSLGVDIVHKLARRLASPEATQKAVRYQVMSGLMAAMLKRRGYTVEPPQPVSIKIPQSKKDDETSAAKDASVKQGGPLKAVGSIAGKGLAMLGTGAAYDAALNAAHKDPGAYFRDILENPDMGRAGMFAINSGIGGGGALALAKGLRTGKMPYVTAGSVGLGLVPGKDLIMSLTGSSRRLGPAIDAWAADKRKGTGIDPKALATLLGGGILAGGGLYGANLLRKAILNRPQPKGRVKVTLPTKEKGDAETSVDLPVEDVNLSQSLVAALGRDTRRRLREESKERKWKRGKGGRLLTNEEPSFRVLEDLPKAAAEGRLQSIIGK